MATDTIQLLSQYKNVVQSTDVISGPTPMPQHRNPWDDPFKFTLYRVMVPVIFALITLVGFIGNILVIFVILSKKQMQTVTNLLLLNLAAADLIFVMVVPPVTAFDYNFFDRWIFGEFVCRAVQYVSSVTGYVTVYTLVLVSIVRYMIVVHNAATVSIRTRRNILIAVGTIWTTMLLSNIPSAVQFDVNSHTNYKCQPRSPDVGRRIVTTFSVMGYLFPLVIITVFYLCIVLHIAQHRSVILDRSRTRSEAKKKQAGRLLFLVVATFFFLMLPLHIHLQVYYWSRIPENKYYEVASILFNCLFYINSVINPLIYNHASKDFRDAFREVVCCQMEICGCGLNPKARGDAAALAAAGLDNACQGTPQTRVAMDDGQFVGTGENSRECSLKKKDVLVVRVPLPAENEDVFRSNRRTESVEMINLTVPIAN